MRAFIAKFVIISITSLILTSCQTTQSKQDDIDLESEKGIIVSYINSGEQQTALKRLRKILATQPQDAELQNLMGIVQLSLKNYQRAIQHFEMSYKADPKPLVKLNISSAYIEMGNHKAARVILAKLAKDEGPGSYTMKERLYHNLGYSYETTDNFDTAIKMYKKAIEENPAYHMSWLQLGRVYEKQKNIPKAVESLERALEFCQSCLEPAEELFMVHMSNGKVLQAKATLQKYLASDDISTFNKTRARQLLSGITAKK